MRSKVLSFAVATFLALAGCGNGGANTGAGASTGGQESGGNGGGVAGSGGTTSSGGTTGSGGTPARGGTTGAAGSSASGGITGRGGTISTGGTTTTSSVGGTTGSGGTMAAGGRTGAGGQTGAGGRTGTSTGGARGTGGNGPGSGGATGTSAGGTQGAGGTTSGTGGSSGIDSGMTVDCSATMPTGGTTYTGASVYGTINGLNYGIWTNGSGGTITVFPNAHAFAASWSDSQNFLAHLGLDFRTAKTYTAYGTIAAEFVESKSGTAGNFSMIGMYGWMHNPCIEWYINEDSFNGLYGRGNITATIDGATYYLSTSQTTGTGGANACESGHTGSWTNITATRGTARQCGTITVSDHFAAWEKQGWTLGTLASVHINVEVGGGTGSIEFPVANVTTTSQ
jgi:endo-1,4-beta-xylanase